MTLPDDSAVVDAVRAGLVKLLAPEDLGQVDLAELGPQTPMLSLPIDSVVLMALMTEIEDIFGAYIDEESAFAFTVIGDIAEHVRCRLAARAGRSDPS